jgi:uncharacterized protein DUF1918
VEQVALRDARAGDLIEIVGHRVADAPRSGEILEVRGDTGRVRFLIRWEDGRETLLFPASDVVVSRPHAER